MNEESPPSPTTPLSNPYPQSPVTVQVTVTPPTWRASLCASDVVSVACQFCVCHMAVSGVVWCRSSPCDESGWSMQLFIVSWGVTYVLSDRLDADTRGYITVPLVGLSCLYKQYFILISAWACYNLHMWVLVKLSTCVATCFKCNSCLSMNVEAIALLLHSSSVGACCHAWKHLCFQSAWPVFFHAVDSN